MDNFILKSSSYIPEIQTTVHEFEHEKTKAKIIWLERKDEEQSFVIGFRTPPYKDTGLTHILEHMVLAGSEKYKAKDPFFAMNKNSVNSFMNASTYLESTLYLFSSANKQDFLNLEDLYLDSVFKPTLAPEIFLQEGWRYEMKDNILGYSGVVFNEMKGASTNPDMVKQYAYFRALFPDSLYTNDSGGDPYYIPTLKYEELVDYHKKYYHPSNSITVIYSETDISQILEKLNNYFNQYDFSNVLDEANQQYLLPEYSESKRYDKFQSSDKLYNLYKAFRFKSARSSKEFLERYILYRLFWDDKTGILYKRLSDSKLINNLGSAVCSYDAISLSDVFCFGGDGIESGNLSKIEDLIHETFSKFDEIEISDELLNSLINKIEFELRELKLDGYYSKSLDLSIKSLFIIRNELDLVSSLSFENTLKTLKQDLKDRQYLNQLVKDIFVKNKLQATVILEPDLKFQENQEQKIKDRLSEIKSKLTETDIKNIRMDNEKLEILHNSKDDESSLPKLHLTDIKRDYSELSYEEISHNVWSMISTKQSIFDFTIQYVLDIEKEDIQNLTLFTRIFQYLNTTNKSNFDLGVEINQIFGKLKFSTSTIIKDKQNFISFGIDCSLLSQNLELGVDILLENLQNIVFDKDIVRSKMKEFLEEMKNTVLDEGYLFTMMRSMAKVSDRQAIDELGSGLSFISYLETLLQNFDNKWKDLEGNFLKFKKLILSESEGRLFIASDHKDNERFLADKLSVFNFNPAYTVSRSLADIKLELKAEDFKYDTVVNYVAQSFEYDGEMSGSMMMIRNILARKFLFEEIRVKGGAYGAMCQIMLTQNIGTMMSYRDPNRDRTLETYKKAIEYLKTFSMSEEDFESLVIGSTAIVDNYKDDDMKFETMVSLVNTEKTWNDWNTIKHELLDTTQNQIHEIAQRLNLIDGSQVIIGGE